MNELQILLEIGTGAANVLHKDRGPYKSVAVFSIVSLEGWGSSSKEMSIAFSVRLSNSLEHIDDLQQGLPSAAHELFRSLVEEFNAPFPPWASGSFCVLARTQTVWTCGWVGGVRCVFFRSNKSAIRSWPHEISIAQSGRTGTVFTRQLTVEGCDTPSWTEFEHVAEGGWGYLSDDAFATGIEQLLESATSPTITDEMISQIGQTCGGSGVLFRFLSPQR